MQFWPLCGPSSMAIKNWHNQSSFPFQPSHLDETRKKERIRGAMPCHDFDNKGDGPEGCW